jgi:protease-4
MHRRWLLLLLLLLGCTGRPRSLVLEQEEEPAAGRPQAGRHGSVLELDLSAGVPESMDAGGWFRLPASRTLTGLVRSVERVGDEEPDGVFVRLGGTRLGWARTEEVGRLLGGLRKQGTPVVCHAHALDNASAWLVTRGCDRIWLSPGGEVSAVGIAAQVLYFKGALDKLKIRAQFVRAGKYKSAVEELTRQGPSQEARESLTATLSSIRASWLDGVARSRPGNRQLRESLEHGPWSAREAKARGLVDELGFDSEARQDALDRGNAAKAKLRFGPDSSGDSAPGIAEIIRILAGAGESVTGRPHVVVVPAQGAIAMQPAGMLMAGAISAKAMSKTLDRLAKDESVRAVVLRIDSPGGSALASDLIWHELMKLRKQKPLIASVGDLAASGGYYLACAAHQIVAERTSIIGSIGVFGGKLVLSDALEHLGVSTVTFAASSEPGAEQRATYLSPLSSWDEATVARVQKQVNSMYELFLKRVAKGRGVPVGAVRKVAEGRIWSGAQGKERGLVDQLGGLQRALELARRMSGLDQDAPVEVQGVTESLLEMLMLGPDVSEAEVAAAVERLDRRQDCAQRVVPEPLRPFVSGIAPLLQGESTLATLPFALIVR